MRQHHERSRRGFPRFLVPLLTGAITLTLAVAVPIATRPTPAAAAGATPILLSDNSASGPGVAVAEDGTAHFAWREERGDDTYIVYCRMQRRAQACDRREEFGPTPLRSFGPVDVVLRPDGTLYIVAFFCCDGIDGATTLWESFDGGTTFSEPRVIGTVGTGSTTIGPGLNTLMTGYSGSASPEGAGVQVMATDDAPPTGYANLNDGLDRYYSGGVALINETTPITAYTDLANTYLRQYDATAGGDYNDPANWLPSTTLSGEDEPTIVSGPNGAFLMTHIEYDGNPLRDAYQLRRISPADGSLSDPFLASDISASLFGTITADSAGGLTAAWTDDGDRAAIRSSHSEDGAGFTAPGVVVEDVRAFNIRVSTAGDAGGFVVWDDNQNQGKVFAAPIPVGGVEPDTNPPEPPTSVGGFLPPKNTDKCTKTVTIKPGVIAAVQGGGCFEEGTGGNWSTKSDVNVNGIRFVGTKDSTRVTVDTKKHTITATAGVVQSAGPIIFSKDPGTWDIDGVTTFEGLEKFKIKLFDFPALGQASVTFADGTAKVHVNLALPKPFDIVTGGTTLTTTMKKGLSLVGIKIEVPSLSVGIFEMRSLSVTYDASSSSFTGHVELKLPPSGKYSTLTVGFRKGKLVRLALAYGGPPFPFTIYPGLWINSAGFDYDGTDGFALGGGADLAIPLSDGPITIDVLGSPPGTGGGFRYADPTNGPARLDLRGTLGLFGFDLANTHAYFVPSDGQFGFATNIDIGWDRLGISGHVTGDVDLNQGTFYSEAALTGCVLICVSGKGVISDVGVAACVDIDLWVTSLQFLVGYKWLSGLTAGTTCNTGAFKTPPAGSAPAPSGVVVGGDGTIYVPYSAGTTSYTVDIPGQGGMPQVSIHDQLSNETVTVDPAHPDEPQSSDHMALIPSPGTDSVRVVLINEPGIVGIGNSYSVTPLPGSVPLARNRARRAGSRETTTGITVASSYDAARVSAEVTGAGRHRSVQWSATNLTAAGRTLQFVETDAHGLQHVLDATAAETGSMDFTVADGRAGQRTIEAVVVNAEGTPLSSTDVATFKAPGWVLPAKPVRLNLKVGKKDRLSVTWQGKRAAGWLVLVKIEDGRRLRITTKRATVTIPQVGRREKVKVTVRGIDQQGRRGPAAAKKRP